mgnify:CR=1 FL=1
MQLRQHGFEFLGDGQSQMRGILQHGHRFVGEMGLLKKSIVSLSDFPGRGRPLDALIPVHTDYRYLVCENYCVFYLSNDGDVVVIRILHQRQDCLRALFIEN